MQIFSYLQRSGTYKIFIIGIGIVLLVVMGGVAPYFPIFFGSFVVCASLEWALFYLFLVSILFQQNLFFLFFILFGYRWVFLELIRKGVASSFHHALSIIVVYSLWYILQPGNFFYFFYNFLFDFLITALVFKCRLKSL